MHTSRVIAAIGVLLIALAGASEVWAQSDLANARREYEITQNVIEKVRRLVEESGNRRAEEALRQAMEVQRQAGRELTSNGARAGKRLTLVARDYARRAAKLAGELSENKEFVFRQLERTREVLRRAREDLRGNDDPRVRDLMRTAQERQGQAETSYRERRFRVALRLTNLARELAHKSLDLSGPGPGTAPEEVMRTLNKTDEALRRAAEDLRAAGSELLDEARGLQDRARMNLREGRLGLALKLTLAARDLAERARRELTEGDGPEAVVREIEATRGFLSNAERFAEENDSDEARALVAEGYSHLERAEGHFRKGEIVAARAQLKLARKKAERAMEVAGGI